MIKYHNEDLWRGSVILIMAGGQYSFFKKGQNKIFFSREDFFNKAYLTITSERLSEHIQMYINYSILMYLFSDNTETYKQSS